MDDGVLSVCAGAHALSLQISVGAGANSLADMWRSRLQCQQRSPPQMEGLAHSAVPVGGLSSPPSLNGSCQNMAARGRHPTCHFISDLKRAEDECIGRLTERASFNSTGCEGMWDNISCWDHVAVGRVITNPCPVPLRNLFGRNGNISRNCTENGWSDVFPTINSACGSEGGSDKLVFYIVVRTLYTLGHSLSLIALIAGSAILCLFRKLHCTRNYIHLNLFLSFILRAIAILVKDAIIFSHHSDCTEQPSLLGCKVSLVMFNYFIMANFFWLLVEGLCWERNDNPIPYRVINGPIVFSIIGNTAACPIATSSLPIPPWIMGQLAELRDEQRRLGRRLAKSTLLLIPLFGVNYVVFVYLDENEAMESYKIIFELVIGSFQGLVVAILYCFLNSEVQGEVKRKWRSVCLTYLSRDYRLHSSSISRNGSENMSQFHRNSRAQSFLQTETTVLAVRAILPAFLREFCCTFRRFQSANLGPCSFTSFLMAKTVPAALL
ncbi:hypothetical protein JZ751_021289 [Albula glossodonta]|uniref:Vasoactive intestinal peptide receptor 2 n=1 Tax=Albula glossodonta TaxID=121402 RepID=A0A8T2MZX0_9TELE|nr:hypothetical protein JZ751_021289 [Albula glossodonta]